MKTIYSLTIFLLAALVSLAQSGNARAEAIRNLQSANEHERDSASAALLKERDSTIAAIESLAEQFIKIDSRGATARTAIRLLGELRAERSVPFLVQNLTFDVFYKASKHLQTPEDIFPCVGALIKIGAVSIGPVLERVKNSGDSNTPRAAASVVRGVLGDELGKARVELELRREKDQENGSACQPCCSCLGQAEKPPRRAWCDSVSIGAGVRTKSPFGSG